MTKASLSNNSLFAACGKLVFQIMAASGSAGVVPEAVPRFRTRQEIWQTGTTSAPWTRCLLETLDKWSFAGRFPLLLLLFLVSSCTTAWSINALLQHPGMAHLFGPFVVGGLGETLRHVTAGICGLLLSSLIVHGNLLLQRGVATTGQVWQGIVVAWRRHPRRLSLIAVLTLFSIHANVVGIRSRMIWQPVLTQHIGTMQEIVTEVLDTTRQAPAQPLSLYDMQAALERDLASLRTGFEQAIQTDPDATGHPLETTRNLNREIRHWGRHFVVYGGFEKEIHDVSLLRPHPLAATVDRLLAESGLNLARSFPGRVAEMVQRQARHRQQSALQLQQEKDKLRQLLVPTGRTQPDARRFFGLEPGQVGEIARRILQILDANQPFQEQQIRDLQTMIDAHTTLLQRIEQTTGGDHAFPRMERKGTFSTLPAQERLRRILEHQDSLHTFYGQASYWRGQQSLFPGELILLGIFFLAVLIDLADPLLFGFGTARVANNNKNGETARMANLLQWEEAFIYYWHQVLIHPENLGLPGNLARISRNRLRQVFHHFQESLDFRSKDPLHHTPWEALRCQVQGLISAPQSLETLRNHARLQTVRHFVGQWETCFLLLMARLLAESPVAHGLQDDEKNQFISDADLDDGGLSTALSFLAADPPPVTSPDPSPTSSPVPAPTSPEQQRHAAQQLILGDMHARFGELRQMILKRNKTLWETISAPSQPTGASPGRIADQSVLEAATARAAAILDEVDAIEKAAEPPDDATLERLRILQEESRKIVLQINRLLPGVYH
ncbi:MAG: hypothetical protein H7833_03085 [Magnetococcus sp. DMHC-1]